MKVLYTASATAVGGRTGHTRTSDGAINFDLSTPKEMGGPGKPGTTNPEQLFAAGYSACFGSAVDYVAKLQKKPITGVEVNALVSLGTTPEGGFKLAVELRVKVDGLDRADAEALVNKAHQVCPYSHATRNNIDVKLTVI